MPERTLRAALISLAWKVVALLKKPLSRPIRIEVHEGNLTVLIAVNPNGQAENKQIPGRFLSDAEHRVWDAIHADEWLVGKEIAARVGKKYDDPRFKALLANLADRGVLDHDDDNDKGFRRAVPQLGTLDAIAVP